MQKHNNNKYYYKIAKAYYCGPVFYTRQDGSKYSNCIIQLLVGRMNKERTKKTVFTLTIKMTDNINTQFGMLMKTFFKTKDCNEVLRIVSNKNFSASEKIELINSAANAIVDYFNNHQPHVLLELYGRNFNGGTEFRIKSISKSNQNYFKDIEFDWPAGFEPGAINEKDKKSLGLNSSTLTNEKSDRIFNNMKNNIHIYKSEIIKDPIFIEKKLWDFPAMREKHKLSTEYVGILLRVFKSCDYSIKGKSTSYISAKGWETFCKDIMIDIPLSAEPALSPAESELEEVL